MVLFVEICLCSKWFYDPCLISELIFYDCCVLLMSSHTLQYSNTSNLKCNKRQFNNTCIFGELTSCCRYRCFHLSDVVQVLYAASQSISPELSETLLSLIAEERGLRAQLEAEADLLEKELDALTTLRQNGFVLPVIEITLNDLFLTTHCKLA